MTLTEVMYMTNKYEFTPMTAKMFTLMDPATAELVKVELQIAYTTGRIDAMTEANAKFDERLGQFIKAVEVAAIAEDVNELILKKSNRSS